MRGRRAYQRFLVSLPVTVEVRNRGGGAVLLGPSVQKRSSVAATMRDASLFGACFVAPGRTQPLEKGTPLTILLKLGARAISLPASVIWSGPGSEDGNVRTGVRVHAEVTDFASRSAFLEYLSNCERL